MKKKQSILWSVKKKETSSCSYLLGTMHVRDKRVFENQEKICSYISTCETFAAEIDLRDIHAESSRSVSLLSEGKSLKDLYGQKKYQKLRSIIKKSYKVDIEMLRYYKPIFISNMIDEQILSKDMTSSLDEFFWNYALSLDKNLVGIESYQEQLEILAQIPIEYQMKSLSGTARNVNRHKRQVAKLVDYYQRGDVYNIFQYSKRYSGALRKTLLYDRNHRMAEKITSLIQTKNTFAAIGAAHLAGKNGVLRLLKKNGLTVKPISLQNSI